jgi:membrane protease YdiL (CAAX protease family)
MSTSRMRPPDPAGPDRLVPPATPGAPLPSRTLAEEIVVVLSLSLVPSAIDALISLLSAPLKGVSVALYPNVNLALQVSGIVFAAAPVWLVFHLVRRSGDGPGRFGLDTATLRGDLPRGVVLGLVVAAVGLGVYLGSVALGVNRFVDPAPPLGHWWTVPVLLLGALQAGLLEEVVVVGYLITRLRQLSLTPVAAVVLSALLRASYHLYQGWGGFAGNLALGLFFGWVFVRRGRTWPLVTAHFLIDALAGIGYILFHTHLPGG